MRSKAILAIEFLAGTDIKEALKEAKGKAERFNLAYVKFDFNGVQFSVGRNADIEQGVKDFHSEKTKEHKFVVCT